MKCPLELLELRSQVQDLNLKFLNGLAGLVGTSFKCERNKMVTWEKLAHVVEWRITEYDFEREQFEVRGSGESMPYYPSEIYLLNLLKEIREQSE